jgi:L-seryl-tRNA(Ser) seleniumtransferase
MPDEVLEAMRSAAGAYVDMHELQQAAGGRLAALRRNDAAIVTSSCTAALTLGTLAEITGGDPAAIARMPGGEGLRTDVVTDVAHPRLYVHAFFMTPDTLSEAEAAVITSRIRAVIDRSKTGDGPVDLQLDH